MQLFALDKESHFKRSKLVSKLCPCFSNWKKKKKPYLLKYIFFSWLGMSKYNKDKCYFFCVYMCIYVFMYLCVYVFEVSVNATGWHWVFSSIFVLLTFGIAFLPTPHFHPLGCIARPVPQGILLSVSMWLCCPMLACRN